MAKKAGTSLGLSIFLVIGFLVALTAGGAVVATVMGERLAHDAISGDLRRINSAQAVLLKKRYSELELVNQALAGASWVTRYLTDAATAAGDATEMRTRVEDFLREHELDLVVFVDPDGKVIFRSGKPEEPAMGADFTADALLASVHDDQQKRSASGIWSLGAGLYHASVVKLTRNFDLLGYIGIAASIEPVADELHRATGAEVVLFLDSPTGPAVVSSTHPRSEEVIAALRREGQGLTRVKRGDTVPAADLEIGDEPWVAFLSPLRDAADKPVGATVGLVEVQGRLAVYRQMKVLLAGAAGAALVIGFVLSLIIGRRILAPVNRLAATAKEIQGGRYEPRFPPAKGNFGPLVVPLQLLARQLRDKEALGSYLDQRQRDLPEPTLLAASDRELDAPAARQLALVGVEMRRFANPKLGYDPEENVARFARDLRRISDSAASRQGTVEAVYGHRILLTFEGEGHAARALAVATEVLLILTHRENAFDEPVPPVIGLTQGSVVTGSIRRGGRSDMVVAGLPVQQLESLLREATPGEIFMAKPLAEALWPTMQSAGIQLQAQRGIVSPMPLYKLTPQASQQFTGVQAPPEQPRGAQNLTLSDIVPGETLGGRFEVLAELGSGPSGTVFKSRDNERADLVKLKVLKPEVLAESARVEQFKHSLELVRMISQPNVLGVFDFGQVDGLAYVSTEFVKGTPLRFFVKEGRSMPLTPAFLVARQIAEGMRSAHRQKLVHGALKPENVLVEPAGRVKVMDFGLSAPIAPAQRDLPNTAAPYLAPEMIEGQPASFRSDVYAWGAVFYELVTGHVPVAGSTPNEVSMKRQLEGLEPPTLRCSEMPASLEAIVLQCLEASPTARYATFEELVRELDALRA